MAQFFTFTPKRKEDGAIDFYTLMDVFDERKEDGTTSPAGHGERKIKFNDMKVLIATEKPFAKKAVDGIKKIITDAGYEVALLEKYTDKAQLLAAVADANALSYEIVQSRVPYDDLYSSKGEMLVPDFSATISRLQTEIYGSTTVNE